MPSTYTLNNGIELIATGEQSGTWGDTTNDNLALIDTALDGQVTITLASAGSSGSPNTLPISDGSASNGRNRLVIFADGGDLGATAFVQLTPNDAEKIVYVRNNLSGSRSIILFQGTYNASNDYEVPAGTTAVVFFNGGGAGAVAANVFNNAHFDALNVAGNTTLGGNLIVNGNVASSLIPSADNTYDLGAVGSEWKDLYIDGTANIDSLVADTADINGGTIDGVTIGGASAGAGTFTTLTATGNVTLGNAATNTVTITADVASNIIPSADNTYDLGAVGSEWKDLYIDGTANIDSLVADTADINGGTIDGVTIGGASAGAGTFTAVTTSGNLTVNGNATIGNAATDTVTINADVASNIIPSVDNTYDLGAVGSEWKDLYIDGVANIDSLVADTADINGGTVDGVTLGTNSAVTEAQIDNININGNAITSTDTNGNIALTPNGTGEVDISKVDIDGGAIDGTVIGGSTPAAISGTTITATGDVDIADKIVHTGDTNTAIRFPAADTVTVETGGTERMRIDSSGNVRIGTTTNPSSSLIRQVLAGDGVYAQWTRTTTTLGGGYVGTDGAGLIFGTHTGTVGSESYNERARIDSSGNLLVGTTSGSEKFKITATSTAAFIVKIEDTRTDGASGAGLMQFIRTSGAVGSISTSTTTTSYNTSSDYRLKEDVQPMVGASDRLMALKPVNFAWKVDGSRVDGFLAHEAQEVVPECVTGSKDEVDADGNPVYQGIDQSKIVPLLTAALQEALTKIEALEARVAALET